MQTQLQNTWPYLYKTPNCPFEFVFTVVLYYSKSVPNEQQTINNFYNFLSIPTMPKQKKNRHICRPKARAAIDTAIATIERQFSKGQSFE